MHIKCAHQLTFQMYHKILQSTAVVRSRCIQTSAVHLAGGRWRVERGLPENNNRYGPLTDLPDYSFVDGRPTPIGRGQLRRKQTNLELAKRIQKLVGEVNFAKERYQKIQEDAQKERERLLKRKLKPKCDS
ncbi:39S ribosomal protein L52, mitochondrial-like [Gigantopelta aegis]|uniref:39S ribosomal protein L52, mitochondrial-like n=1 Tax=Gigantopelta aegis TaxID=1735272 RepID=UPI001B88CE1C|nr:39S ribosomal protein L52, mitochondrial-like [Gigantopelta aegis]